MEWIVIGCGCLICFVGAVWIAPWPWRKPLERPWLDLLRWQLPNAAETVATCAPAPSWSDLNHLLKYGHWPWEDPITSWNAFSIPWDSLKYHIHVDTAFPSTKGMKARAVNAYYRSLIERQMRYSSTPFRGGEMTKTKEEQAVLDAVRTARDCHNLPLDAYLRSGGTKIRVASTLFHCILAAEEARRESLKPKKVAMVVQVYVPSTNYYLTQTVELEEGARANTAFYEAWRKSNA